MAGEAEDARALALLGAVGGVGVGAERDDGGQGRDGFGVVDDGWAAVEADHRRERRLEARVAALALQRLHQRALLAADVGAGAARDGDLEVEVAAEDVLANQAGVVRLTHRALHLPAREGQLAAHIDEGVMNVGGVGGEDRPLDEQMRADLHDHAVFEGARLALVAVDGQVTRLGGGLGQEAPLHASGEARAAAPAQAGLFDLLGQRLRRDGAQRLRQRRIAAVLAVDLDAVNAWHLEVFRHDARVRSQGKRLALRHDGIQCVGHTYEAFPPRAPALAASELAPAPLPVVCVLSRFQLPPRPATPSPRSSRASSVSALAVVTFSTNSSFTWSAGAMPQAARHSMVLSVYFPSGVVSPRRTPRRASRCASTSSQPRR